MREGQRGGRRQRAVKRRRTIKSFFLGGRFLSDIFLFYFPFVVNFPRHSKLMEDTDFHSLWYFLVSRYLTLKIKRCHSVYYWFFFLIFLSNLDIPQNMYPIHHRSVCAAFLDRREWSSVKTWARYVVPSTVGPSCGPVYLGGVRVRVRWRGVFGAQELEEGEVVYAMKKYMKNSVTARNDDRGHAPNISVNVNRKRNQT